jgi:hypothetical protein
MAFEWSALRQVQRLACGVLSRLETDDDPLWIVSVRLAQPLPYWKVKCAGRTLASKASGILTDVWIETYRLPPVWRVNPAGSGGCLESRPCRARHVTRAHHSPPIRVVLWEETGLQNRSAGFDSLTARQVIQVWVAGIPAAL